MLIIFLRYLFEKASRNEFRYEKATSGQQLWQRGGGVALAVKSKGFRLYSLIMKWKETYLRDL